MTLEQLMQALLDARMAGVPAQANVVIDLQTDLYPLVRVRTALIQRYGNKLPEVILTY